MEPEKRIRRLIAEILSKTAFRKQTALRKKSGYYPPSGFVKGKVVKFKDIPGLRAVRDEDYDYPSWIMYPENSEFPAGILYGSGQLKYRTQMQKLVWTDWVDADVNFGDDLENAMRYVFMKLHEKADVLKEAGMETRTVRAAGIWHIFSEGSSVGQLRRNGTVYFYRPEEGGIEISDINFGDDIKNAMRWIWLKAHS